MEAFLSPKDLALAIGVSESSLKRWVDSGSLRAVKTEGGHRRIPIQEAVRFVRASKAVIVRPDLLGLEDVSQTALAEAPEDREGQKLMRALLSDDAATARGLILGGYLSGLGVGALFDGPLRSALEGIGELWKHNEDGIWIEHRATDTCLQAVQVLRSTMPEPAADAPIAVSAALSGDPYTLPPLLAGIVATEAGFVARNLGPDTPVSALARALERWVPGLVCVSVSTSHEAGQLAGLLRPIQEALLDMQGHLVVGGRAAYAREVPAGPNVSYAATMSELAAFARGLRSAPNLTSGRSRSARATRRPRT